MSINILLTGKPEVAFHTRADDPAPETRVGTSGDNHWCSVEFSFGELTVFTATPEQAEAITDGFRRAFPAA